MPHSEVFYAERSDFIPNVYTMPLGTMTICWAFLEILRFTVTSQGKNVFISFFPHPCLLSSIAFQTIRRPSFLFVLSLLSASSVFFLVVKSNHTATPTIRPTNNFRLSGRADGHKVRPYTMTSRTFFALPGERTDIKSAPTP